MTQPTNTKPLLQVQCRICRERLTLNEDGLAARINGTDPHQQLRQHLSSYHGTELASIAYRAGWLTDMLAFSCPNDPERWRSNAMSLFDAYMRGEL